MTIKKETCLLHWVVKYTNERNIAYHFIPTFIVKIKFQLNHINAINKVIRMGIYNSCNHVMSSHYENTCVVQLLER